MDHHIMYSGFLFTLLIISGNGHIYREIKSFDRNTTKGFGYIFLDMEYFNAMNVNLEWFHGILIQFPERHFSQQNTSNGDFALESILQTLPTNVGVSIITKSLSSGWISREILKKHGSRISTVFIDPKIASHESSLNALKDVENIGIQVGIYLNSQDSLPNTINDFKGLPILVFHEITDDYYEYDTISRHFDEIKERVMNSVSKVQYVKSILFCFQPNQTTLLRTKETEIIMRHEAMTAMYAYHWGRKAKQFVVFIKNRSVAQSPFETSDLFDIDMLTGKIFITAGKAHRNIVNNINSNKNKDSRRHVRMYKNDLSEAIFGFKTGVYNLSKLKMKISNSMQNLTSEVHESISEKWITLLITLQSRNYISHRKFVKFVCDVTYFISKKALEHPNSIRALIFDMCHAFNKGNSRNKIKFVDDDWSEEMNSELNECFDRLHHSGVLFGYDDCTADKFTKDILKNFTEIVLLEPWDISDENSVEYFRDTMEELRNYKTRFTNKELYLRVFTADGFNDDCLSAKTLFYGVQSQAVIVGSVSVFVADSNNPPSASGYILSMLNDICVAVDQELPNRYDPFVGNAGITFDLTRKPFTTLESEEITEFINLINYKFNLIEVIVGQELGLLKKLSTAFEKIFANIVTSNVESESLEFLINLGNICALQNGTRENLISYLNFKFSFQIHFEVDDLSVDISESVSFMKDFILYMKSFNHRIGILTKFNTGTIPENLTKELSGLCDFIIFDVNVNEQLLFYFDPKEIRRSIYDVKRALSKLFQNILHYISTFKEVNQNIEVIIKAKYTLTDKSNLRSYLSFWRYIDELAVTHGFAFLINDAFGGEFLPSLSTYSLGWWTVQNQTMWRDPRFYTDLQAEYFNLITPVPESNNDEKIQYTEGNKWAYIIPGVSLVILCLLAMMALILYRQNRKKLIPDIEMDEFKHGRANPPEEFTEDEYFMMRYLEEEFEIGEFDFKPEQSTIIGVGKFGIVYKSDIPKCGGVVAVKIPNPNSRNIESSSQIRSFLREIKIMMFLGEHENLLRLLGAYTCQAQEGIVQIVTEFCENGSLLKHLRSIKFTGNNVLFELYRFCQEIACGMDWLRLKKIIHGDLSARNVSLNNVLTCKISDFGMSKKLDEFQTVYKKKDSGNLPWAWMAYETLSRLEFTTKSDVWSMGVTFWEIFSLGSHPYQGENYCPEFIQMMKDGNILPRPKLATEANYDEIRTCWNLDPLLRPEPAHFVMHFGNERRSLYAKIN